MITKEDISQKIYAADVKNFGLLWEDCEQLLQQPGYHINFKIEKVS